MVPQSLTLGKEEIKPDEPLSLPVYMELSTELSTKSLVCTLVIVDGNVWIYHRVPSAVPLSPWLEAVWQWASFLSSSTVTESLFSAAHKSGARGWGLAWAGLPWRHLAQLRQLVNHLIPSQQKLPFHLKQKSEFIFEEWDEIKNYNLITLIAIIIRLDVNK